MSELGNYLGKSTDGGGVVIEPREFREDESVSSLETDYEYAFTDVTDGWKVKYTTSAWEGYVEL